MSALAPVLYRPARLPDDAATLIDLNAEYLEFVFSGVAARFPVTLADVFPGGDIRGYLAGALEKIVGAGPPASIFYLLEQAGQVIGMGGLRTVRPGVAEMKRVYVRDAAKGQGQGRALVERLMADAREFGFHTLFLDTAPTLTTAIGLYERLGFTPIAAYPEVEVPPIMHPHWVFMGRAL
jgi:ribosomal protein S18 acetylase RimI-like enzyme